MALRTPLTSGEVEQLKALLGRAEDQLLVDLVHEEARLRTAHIAETCFSLSHAEQLLHAWRWTYEVGAVR